MIEVSPSTLRRIEQGRVGLKGPALNALLDLYGVTDTDLRTTLLSMARSGKQRGWWAKYGDLPGSYRQFIGLESAASEIHNFETVETRFADHTAQVRDSKDRQGPVLFWAGIKERWP